MRVTKRTVTKSYRALTDVRWKGKLYPAGAIIENLSRWDAQQIGIGYQIEPRPEPTDPVR